MICNFQDKLSKDALSIVDGRVLIRCYATAKWPIPSPTPKGREFFLGLRWIYFHYMSLHSVHGRALQFLFGDLNGTTFVLFTETGKRQFRIKVSMCLNRWLINSKQLVCSWLWILLWQFGSKITPRVPLNNRKVFLSHFRIHSERFSRCLNLCRSLSMVFKTVRKIIRIKRTENMI